MEKLFRNFGKRTLAFFAANWGVAVVALVCAMILWGFVLTNQNPERTKTVANVPLSFTDEADLNARGLVVLGERSEILRDVTVRVNTTLLNYSGLTADDITATASLRNVNYAGTHEVTIEATTTNGTVLSVSPSKIIVQIDGLNDKVIPVIVDVTGNGVSSLWYGEPVASLSEVTISGPVSIISGINRAVCTVNIDDYTTSLQESRTLTLYGADGNEVPFSLLRGAIPWVYVSMEILPQKTVSFDMEGAMLGIQGLPATYEIVLTTNPATVTIVGERSVLDSIDKLQLESWDISGKTEPQTKELAIINIPTGVRIIGDYVSVQATADIHEKTMEKVFPNVNIEIRNKSTGKRYTLSAGSMDIKISGRISVINQIESSNIKLYVDVGGLNLGQHTVVVQVGLTNTSLLAEIIYELENNEVRVTVT